MNKAYRVVWNAVTGTWNAVSEVAKRCGKGSTVRAVAAVSAAALALFAGTEALAETRTEAGSSEVEVSDEKELKQDVSPFGLGIGPMMAGFGTVLGTQATTLDEQGVAIGQYASAGRVNAAENSGATALGSRANAAGEGSTALGSNARSLGGSSIAIGPYTNAHGIASAAIGWNSSVRSNADFSVALGASSVADRAMTVSVGSAGSERQITNVANATQGTDAVNKRQLDAALAGVGGGADPLSVKYDSSAKNSVMLGGGAAGTKIDNVAAGELSATSKEAVNGGQLFATNQRVSTAEGHITNIQGDIGTINTSIGSIQGDVTNVGNRVTNVEGDITTIQGTLGNAVMYDSAAKTSITLGDGTSAVTLKNVADGVAAKDAVNKGQLDRLRDALGEADGLAVKYDSAAQNAITLGGAAGTKIANVAAGELSATSKDAVNGGQLFATNQNVDHLGTRVTNVEGDLTSLHTNINNGTVGLVRQDADTLAISVAADKGGSSVNFAGADGDRRLAGVADGVAQNDAVNVKQLKGAGLIGDGGNLMDAVVYDAGSNKAQITLGGLGANAAPVILTNVADGKSQYDAVNFGQLERLQGHVNSIDNRVTNLENSGGSGGGSNGNGNDGQSPVIVDGRNPFFEATVPKSDQASAKASVGQGRGNTAGGANAKVEGNFGTALGANSSAIADKAVAVGSGAVASGAGSMALGSDAQASGANSVALGQGSVASRANSVSVGSAGNERQVTNVAAGTAMTDAVNVQQLQDAQASSAAYTDARLDQVQSTVQGVKRDASAAAAGAMAAANLPQSINPGKAMMSAAMANVGGESAVAIGVSKVADNGRWITKFSGTANTRGQVGVGAGIGFQW